METEIKDYLNKECLGRLVENIYDNFIHKDSDNIIEIESKLVGVTKAADDSKVLKGINDGYNGTDIYPDNNGLIAITVDTGLKATPEIGELLISADTDYLATKEDLSNIEAIKLKTPIILWGNSFDGSGDINGAIDLDGEGIYNIGTLTFGADSFIYYNGTNSIVCDPNLTVPGAIHNNNYYSTDGNHTLMRYYPDDSSLEIGEEVENIILMRPVKCDANITAPNITEIESKLKDVTINKEQYFVIDTNVSIPGCDITDIAGIDFMDGNYLDGSIISDIQFKLEGITKAADDSEVLKGLIINSEQSVYPLGGNAINIDAGKGVDINESSPGNINISADTNYLATREYVDNKLDNITPSIDNKPFIVLEELPNEPEEGNENKIHIVPSEGKTADNNSYTEYAWVNDTWEKFGEFSVDVDLSEYATKEYVDDNKVDKKDIVIEKLENSSLYNYIVNLKEGENIIDEEKIGKTVILGWNNTNTGFNYGSFLTGQGNKLINSNYSILSGSGNEINNSNNSSISGESNTITDSLHSSANGRNNKIISSTNSLVNGQQNNLTGSLYSNVDGYNNNITSSNYSNVSGVDNIINSSPYVNVEGYNNNVKNSSHSHVEGDQNIVENAQYSHIEGTNNKITSHYSHASGRYNKFIKNSDDTDEYNTQFSVGNGNSDNRHNSFEIKQNGDVYIADSSDDSEYYEKPMVKLYPIGDKIEEKEVFNVKNIKLNTTNPPGWTFNNTTELDNDLKLDTKYRIVIPELSIDSIFTSRIISRDYITITDSKQQSMSSPFVDDSIFSVYQSPSSNNLQVYIKTTETSVTIQIYEIIESIKKIDSKYLPSTSPNANQILYKTIDNKPINFSHANLISNEYFEDYGLLTFADDLEICPTMTSIINLKYIELPEGIKYTSSGMFFGCSNLEKAVLPESLENIALPGFNNCYKLKEVNIPSKITELPQQCFYNTYELTHIYLNNVTKLGNTAFCGSGITTLGVNKLKEIGNEVFSNSNLVYFNSGTVETIGYRAFIGCKNLISVKFDSALTSIGDYAFQDCTSLINVDMKDSTKLTKLSGSCFDRCNSLTNIIIYNIETLTGSCFTGCPLKSVHIESTEIKEYRGSFAGTSLEFFYTKSSAPIESYFSPNKLKTMIFDTTDFVNIGGDLSRFKNFTTIYVNVDLLEQYQTTYSDYSWLFKPITGKISGNNDNSWTGTESEYESLDEYDSNTIYYIIEEDEQL